MYATCIDTCSTLIIHKVFHIQVRLGGGGGGGGPDPPPPPCVHPCRPTLAAADGLHHRYKSGKQPNKSRSGHGHLQKKSVHSECRAPMTSQSGCNMLIHCMVDCISLIPKVLNPDWVHDHAKSSRWVILKLQSETRIDCRNVNA